MVGRPNKEFVDEAVVVEAVEVAEVAEGVVEGGGLMVKSGAARAGEGEMRGDDW